MSRYDPRPPAPKKKPAPWFPPGHQDRPWEPGQPTTGPGAPGSPDPGPAQPPQLPGGAPQAPAPIDWAALISRDPSWIARLAELTRLRHDAVVGYGDATGIPGADAATAAEAANNPYSVTAMLRQQYATNQRGLANQANAHGVLFSGTADQNRSNESNAATQRSFDANQRLLSMLGGYGDQQQQAYADAYQRLAANPPVSPVATDPAAATAVPTAQPAAPAPAMNQYLPGAPLTFHPPAAPKPLSHATPVKRPGAYKPPTKLPSRATSVLPTRYG